MIAARAILSYCFVLFALSQQAIAQSCNATSPCTTGCCSKFGFCGFGPDYCEESVCVANCDRKAECDPGGFTLEYAEAEKCPLNACCSSWGFCGVSEEFCGEETPKKPSCSNSQGLSRVVGYYEGWAIDRACHKFAPELIPRGVYTHLNFAYATIDPDTFEIGSAMAQDPAMYHRLVRLKRRDPDLKVYITIGGWSFNSPGRTASTLSELAGSEQHQQAFFNSLLSFLSTYGFDGIDLDWQYPGSIERGGCPADFATFPTFVSNLRQALKSSGGRDGLSITIPASYWYLRHYDIANLEKNVDFFNMLTYDLHGTWDKNGPWSSASLAAHTNLTDISDALNLLWRSGIKSDNVVLGTAFHGRGFTAADPDCLTPGCPYISGSDAQHCSGETGLIFNSEIALMNRTDVNSHLDKAAAVNYISFDNDQWVAYDDETTLKMKVEFAQSQCLGGIMVSAVSRDTREGRYSSAIGDAVVETTKKPAEPVKDQRKISARLNQNAGHSVLRHPQCMWTNCGSECPSGYKNVENANGRKDSNMGPLERETMVDPTACQDSDVRLWCCPVSDMPTCSWSGYRQGQCRSGCTDGQVEVGSHAELCENEGYAAACCDAEVGSVRLYNTCSWEGDGGGYQGAETGGGNCGNPDFSCPDEWSKVATSASGSGDVQCRIPSKYGWVYSERPYCCDTSDYNVKWTSCTIHGKDGHTSDNPGYCPGDCPDGRFRVALDQQAEGCSSGAAATCCVPNANTIAEDLPDEDRRIAEVLDEFMQDRQGYCEADIKDRTPSRRDLSASALEERGPTFELSSVMPQVEELLTNILDDVASQNQIDAWDDAIYKDYPLLRAGTLEPYMSQMPNQSFENIAAYLEYHQIDYSGTQNIACGMNYFEAHIAAKLDEDGPEPLVCACSGEGLCGENGIVCASRPEEEEEEDEIVHDEQKRDDNGGVVLEKRGGGGRRPFHYKFTCADGTALQGVFKSDPYHYASQWKDDDDIWKRAWTEADEDNSLTTDPEILTTKAQWSAYTKLVKGKTEIQWATEHILELQFVKELIIAVATGEYRGTALDAGNLDSAFIAWLLEGSLANPSPLPNQKASAKTRKKILERFFWILGNKLNKKHFMILHETLNNWKVSIWSSNDPIENSGLVKSIKAARGKAEFCLILCSIKKAITVFGYMNDPVAMSNFADISNEFRAEWRRIAREWMTSSDNPNALRSTGEDDIEIKQFADKAETLYDEIMKRQLEGMTDHIQRWVMRHAENVRTSLKNQQPADEKDWDSWALQAREATELYDRQVDNLQFHTSTFDGQQPKPQQSTDDDESSSDDSGSSDDDSQPSTDDEPEDSQASSDDGLSSDDD